MNLPSHSVVGAGAGYQRTPDDVAAANILCRQHFSMAPVTRAKTVDSLP